MQMRPPAACTASVTSRCLARCRRPLSVPAKGLVQPAAFGAMPPVTMSPTPPRARSAKYAASFG